MAVFYTGGHNMGLATLGNVVDGGLGGLSDWTRYTCDYTRAVERRYGVVRCKAGFSMVVLLN
jgi:hypothetical protein